MILSYIVVVHRHTLWVTYITSFVRWVAQDNHTKASQSMAEGIYL